MTQVQLEERLGNIKGILFAVTDKHDEVLGYWRRLQKATLLHIDAHDDMDYVPADTGGRKLVKITNFICAAMHEGSVSSVYWLNPFSIKKRLQYFGSNENFVNGGELNPHKLSTANDPEGGIHWQQTHRDMGRSGFVNYPSAKIIEGVDIKKPFILDIDLDAFCCSQPDSIQNHDHRHPTEDYMKNIEDTFKFLRKLEKPDLITIARSVSLKDPLDTYVPQTKVDAVQRHLIQGLEEVYIR